MIEVIFMTYSDATKRATYKYHAAKIKRVPLDMQASEYETIKESASKAGETINGYIKRAIRERQARESIKP